MFRRSNKSTLHGILVQIVQLLTHHFIATDNLWMHSLLPNLMLAGCFMGRTVMGQLLQKPFSTLRFELLD